MALPVSTPALQMIQKSSLCLPGSIWDSATWKQGCLRTAANISDSSAQVYQQHLIPHCMLWGVESFQREYTLHFILWVRIHSLMKYFYSQTPLLYLNKWEGYFFNCILWLNSSAFVFRGLKVTHDNKNFFHSGIWHGNWNRGQNLFLTYLDKSDDVLSKKWPLWPGCCLPHKKISTINEFYFPCLWHSDFNLVHPVGFISRFQSIIYGILQRKPLL